MIRVPPFITSSTINIKSKKMPLLLLKLAGSSEYIGMLREGERKKWRERKEEIWR